MTNTTKKEIDPIAARLDAIEHNLKGTIDRQDEVIQNLNKTIDELKNKSVATSSDVDEGVILDRQSAHTMRMPVVDGAPVIEGKLERVIGVAGLEYLMNVKTADGKEYSFPFGCDVGRLDFSDKKTKDIQTTSYENIKTMDFKLQDIDTNDLTGASKVEKGKIIGEGGLVSEVDRSGGRPVATGRKIRTVVRSDIRYYTIEYNGEKFTLSSDELGNIRI
jgi:hypothetical protein